MKNKYIKSWITNIYIHTTRNYNNVRSCFQIFTTIRVTYLKWRTSVHLDGRLPGLYQRDIRPSSRDALCGNSVMRSGNIFVLRKHSYATEGREMFPACIMQRICGKSHSHKSKKHIRREASWETCISDWCISSKTVLANKSKREITKNIRPINYK